MLNLIEMISTIRTTNWVSYSTNHDVSKERSRDDTYEQSYYKVNFPALVFLPAHRHCQQQKKKNGYVKEKVQCYIKGLSQK